MRTFCRERIKTVEKSNSLTWKDSVDLPVLIPSHQIFSA